MNLKLFIAKKIKTRQSNSIACASVAISIAVMFIAIAITDGFKKEIAGKAVGFSGEMVLTAPGQSITNDLYPVMKNLSFISEIKALSSVSAVEGVAYKPGMLKTDENVEGILFKGIDSLYSLKFYADHLIAGELPRFDGKIPRNDILISKRLAASLEYNVGDDITAYFIDDNVRVRKFRISGLYDIQLEEIDKTLALVDIRQVQRLNGWTEDEVSGQEIFFVSGANGNRTAEEIDRIVMDLTTDDDSSVVANRVRDLYPHLFDWLSLLDLNVLVVLALMIAVAGFNMVSGLLIILFEKMSMIGLLKALGMKTQDICKVFIYRASFIIIKGMVVGNVIALILSFVQQRFELMSLNPDSYFVDHIPISLDPWSLILLNLISFVVMVLIMIIPSLFIARISPDKTIRKS